MIAECGLFFGARGVCCVVVTPLSHRRLLASYGTFPVYMVMPDRSMNKRSTAELLQSIGGGILPPAVAAAGAVPSQRTVEAGHTGHAPVGHVSSWNIPDVCGRRHACTCVHVYARRGVAAAYS